MSVRFRNSIVLICLVLLATACDALPIPQFTLVTRTPPPPPGPTLTPAPGGVVNFRVRVPGSTPVGATVVAQVLDEISGGWTTVPLTGNGEVWTGSTLATLGRGLRYRYARLAPTPAQEATPTAQPVPYRLFQVDQAADTIEDSIAAWNDAPFAGEQGAIVGVVRNSNTGQGVAGLIVSAAGQLTLTAWDGSYAFYNVPAGRQRVTVLAPDGALRPAQGAVDVPPSQIATLDLAAPDPNAVHITFVVQPPAGTDPTAVVRLVGSLAQAGDVFLPNSTGSSVVATRAPTLSPLGDGRLAVIVLAHQGTLLRYSYTLGDGVWNGELDANGGRRVREYVVPAADAIVSDTITSWHAGPSAPVTFEVTTPATTPPNDSLAIQFRTQAWSPPLPMWRAGVNVWRFVLSNPESFDGNVFYRYCRNFACGAADDAATAEVGALSRAFTPTLLPQTRKDTVSTWRWQTAAPAVDAVLPAPAPRAGFVAGLDLAEAWQPNALPLYGETVRGAQALAANTLTVFRRGTLRNLLPPIYADDLALSMPPAELRALAEQARLAGLNVTVHPVTCAYTPYGACEYWNGVAFTPEFWNNWFTAYERYLLTQAAVATQAGATALVVADFKLRPAFPGEPEAAADADARWRDLLNKVRARFRGQLVVELLMGQSVWPNPPAFVDAVDAVRVFWWAALATNNATAPADLAANAGGLLDTQVWPLQQRFNKPLSLSLAYYSVDGAATQCLPRPDGQCHAFTDFDPAAADVVRYSLDLREQAEAYQAVLSAAYTRPWVAGVTAFGYNPLVALQDKSVSVRGKPAETLLAAWFLRYQGR